MLLLGCASPLCIGDIAYIRHSQAIIESLSKIATLNKLKALPEIPEHFIQSFDRHLPLMTTH